MIKRLFRALGAVFKAIGLFCEGFAEPNHPLPKKPANPSQRNERLKYLLSLEKLSPDQSREVDLLSSDYSGNIVFLDDPVSVKEHL